MKKLWLLAAGILLFGAVAVAVVLLATGDSPVAGMLAPGPEPSSQRPAAPTASPAGQPLVPKGTPQVPGPQVRYGPPPPTPPEGSWEAVPPVARASALGSLGGAVGRGLNEIQPRLAACFDEDTQARHGQMPLTQTQDQAPMPDNGTTVLLLQIETLSGSARIVDAPLETRGGASDGLVACAQGVLRGRTFEVPGATPGERYRLLYSLLP